MFLLSSSSISNRLLTRYLPTVDKSYLAGSKNNAFNAFLAPSTVTGSPGLNFLFNSNNDCLDLEKDIFQLFFENNHYVKFEK